MKKALLIVLLMLLPQLALAATKTVVLSAPSQSIQTWTVPSDFQSLVSIQVIGAGGGGADSASANAGGGGGGAFAKITSLSLTPGNPVSYEVGWPGAWDNYDNTSGYAGGDTFFNGTSCAGSSVCAKGGSGGGVGSGGSGGSSAASVGSLIYAGGAGSLASAGGGGGGAAGLNGNGNTASGTSGGSGDAGSGGAGGVVNVGSGAGSSGSEFGTGYGSGGGASSGAQGGSYGGGGGGSYVENLGGGPYGSGGGIAGAGLIVITYNSACAATTGNHSVTYATAGSGCSFSVPSYGTLTVQEWGAGGSGADRGFKGTAGTASTFNSTVSAGGGAAGGSSGGAGGTASGGTVDTNGNAGAAASNPGGNGGSAPSGGAGGAGVSSGLPSAGTQPGGGGGASASGSNSGGGGSGAYVSKTYVSGASGAPAFGASISVVVGTGGSYSSTKNGADGEVVVTWTDPVTCSVSFSQNPLAYGSSVTISWSSANATTMYINSIGYVSATGYATVQPSATTDYSCTATGAGGATGTQSAVLTVTPPSSPAATIVASSTSVYVGQPVGIHAHFAAGSGDALTADNIDSPVGNGLGATTNPDTDKYITFTPSSAGTYTFYARVQTGYYPSWTTYAQTSITATASPSCTISFDQNPVSQGQSTLLQYSSSNATSFSINNVGSVTPNTSSSVSVEPSQTTDYTGSASAGGVTNTCPATLTVSCTQSWSCGGSNGETIVQTNTDCSTTNLATCVSPQYCSTGVSSCTYPVISFNSSGNKTGHLQILPNIALPDNPVIVDWNVSNAQSCMVTGTNGDSWSGLSGSDSSKNIVGETTYTLSCIGYGSNPNVNETQTVNLTPSYQEQ